MKRLKGLMFGISALIVGASGYVIASSNVLSNPTSKNDLVETYASNPIQPDIDEITEYEVKSYYDYIDSYLNKEVSLRDIVVPNDPNLPNEYSQIQYLQSTRNQYIDTEFYPTNKTEIRANIRFKNYNSNYSSDASIFGCSNTAEKQVFQMNFGGNANQYNQLYCWTNVGYSNGDEIKNFVVSDSFLEDAFFLTFRSGYVSYGSVYKEDLLETTWQQMSIPMYIFASNSAGTAKILKNYEMFVYDFQIYDNGQLVRNFVPCYRNSDEIMGLYDLVEGKFYTSASGTNFELSNYNEVSLKGNGTKDTPYQISTALELAWLSYQHTILSAYKEGSYYVLTNDIQLNDETFSLDGTISGGDGIVYEWYSIGGDNQDTTITYAFRGNFDGQGYSISGLYQNSQNEFRCGFFRQIFGNREIKNINIENSYIYSGTNASNTAWGAGIIGKYSGGTTSLVKNCHFNGYVGSVGNIVGGIIGQSSYVKIEECSFQGKMDGNNYTSGITANADHTIITNCKVDAEINGGAEQTAGIVALLQIDSLVEKCYSKGVISGTTKVAGIVAQPRNNTYVKNCENHADIIAAESQIGGIAGTYGAGEITNCVNYGKVSGNSGFGIGGIVGYVSCGASNGRVKNCVNYGTISSNKHTGCGGIVGTSQTSSGNCEILDCKNYADILVTSSGHAAGINGFASRNLVVKNCYNKGRVKGTFGLGAIIGTISGGTNSEAEWANVTISDCHAVAVSGNPLVSGTQKVKILTIKNCSMSYDNVGPAFAIIGNFEQVKTKTVVENFIVNYSNPINSGVRLFAPIKGEVIVRNVIFNVKCKKYLYSTTPITASVAATGKLDCDGIILTAKTTNNGTQKYYYGEKFSNIYVSWKTGTFGLISFDGKGSFQNVVDEELLINKGYSKLTA